MMNSWLVETNHHRSVYRNFIEINPEAAGKLNVSDEQKVRGSSSTSSIEVLAKLTDTNTCSISANNRLP